MPIPEQAQLTLNTARIEGETTRALNAVAQAYNRSPHFHRHLKRLQIPATTSTSSSTLIDIAPLGTPFEVAGFTKFEEWTDVDIDVFGSGFPTNTGQHLWLAVQLRDPVSGAVHGPTSNRHVGKMMMQTAGAHFSFTGVARLAGVPAGKWDVRLRWRVAGGGEINFDTKDDLCMSVTETIPAPRAA